MYSKNIRFLNLNRLPLSEKQRKQFRNPDNDPRGPWVSSDFTAQGTRPNQMYTIKTPAGVEYSPPSGRCWKNVEAVYKKQLAEGRMWFGKDGKGIPRRKTYLAEREGRVPWTWWANTEVGHNQEGKQETGRILGSVEIFETPKPVSLIDRIVRIATKPDDIILDSFAGSGTTAHAVLNLNKEDGGNRKFILVELEDYADSITAERVKRVMDGYGSNGKEVEGTGGGFSFYELGKPLFLSDGSVNKDVPIDKLREYIYFTETKKQLPEAHPENPYFLGSEDGNSYYLLHEHEEPMALDYDFLSTLVKKDEAYIIYADRCLIDEEFMRKHNIIFKKVPRDIVRF